MVSAYVESPNLPSSSLYSLSITCLTMFSLSVCQIYLTNAMNTSRLYPVLEVVCEGVRWAVLEAGEVVIVRETEAVRDGQVEVVVLMQ